MADPRRKRRWRRRAAVAAGAVAVLGGGGYAAYAQVSRADPASTYRVATASMGSVSQSLTLTGTVKRVSQVTATFPVSGTVTALSVKVGDTVTAGQPLATIDQTPLQAAVTDAQAQLLQAQAQLTTDQSTTIQTTSTASGAVSGGTAAGTGTGSSPSGTSTASSSLGSTSGRTSGSSGGSGGTTGGAPATHVSMPDPVPMQTAVAAMNAAAKAETMVCVPVLAAQPVVTHTPATSSSTSPASSSSSTSPTSSSSSTSPTSSSSSTSPTSSSSSSSTSPASSSSSTSPATSSATTYPVTAQQIAACVPALQAWATALGKAQAAVTGYAGALTKAQQQLAQAAKVASTATSTASPAAAPTASARTASTGSSGASSSSRTGSTGSGTSQASTGGLSTADAEASKEAKILTDQANITAAEQALTAAQGDLAASTLTAPMAGVVGAIGLGVGQNESSSSGVTIVGAGAATVTIHVPVTKLSSIKVGQAATVSPPGLGILRGAVTQVGMLPTSSGGTGASQTVTYDVTVTLPESPQTLASDTYAVTTVTTASASGVLTVPVSAVPGVTSGAAHVAVLKDGTPTQTVVTVGAVGGGLAEVRTGLSAGDQVVIADATAALPTNSTNSVRGLTGGQGGPPGNGRVGTGGAAPGR